MLTIIFVSEFNVIGLGQFQYHFFTPYILYGYLPIVPYNSNLLAIFKIQFVCQHPEAHLHSTLAVNQTAVSLSLDRILVGTNPI